MVGKIIWRNEKRKLGTLHEMPGNPRQASQKQVDDLDASLARFSLADPLVINTDDTVVGGHFRRSRLIAKYGEDQEIDVRVPDRELTPAEVRELNLRLNKNTGDWDNDSLANFDEALLTDIGFDREELDEVFGLRVNEDYNVEKRMNEALEKGPQRVKAGEIWQLGDHRLIIDDCTKPETWAQLLGTERYDLLFTDPPYKLDYKARSKKVTTKDGKIKKEAKGDGQDARSGEHKTGRFKGYLRTKDGVVKKNQRVYPQITKHGVPEYDEWLAIAQKHQNPQGSNIMVFEAWRNTRGLWNAIEAYWRVTNLLIWHLPGRYQGFSRPYEFFHKFDIAPIGDAGPKPAYNDEMEPEFERYMLDFGERLVNNYTVSIYGHDGKPEWFGPHRPQEEKSTGYYKRVRRKSKFAKVSDHVTHPGANEAKIGRGLIFGIKPLEVLIPYVKILCPRQGIIMDPFGGSGSLLIAAEIMSRRARVIEIEPIFAELIIDRWEQFTHSQAVKIKEKPTRGPIDKPDSRSQDTVGEIPTGPRQQTAKAKKIAPKEGKKSKTHVQTT